MQLQLSTNFQPDNDKIAVVQFKTLIGQSPIAEVRIDFAFEGTNRHWVTIVDFTRDMSLSAYSQMKIGLAAAELIDSFFTGNDCPSRIEV